MDFTNKVVIVTGGSSGIGASSAKLFAEHGALLVLVGRNNQRLDEVATECQSFKGNVPLKIALDLTHEGSCQEVVRQTIAKFKKIDILINSAGKGTITSLFDDNTIEFDSIVDLNLRVTYRMTQLCVPHLVKTKGNIVNIYGAPLRVRPGMLPYCMIRDAIERFTKAGAIELAHEGVRMNGVRPSITRTNFLRNFNVPEEYASYAYDSVAADLMPSKKPIEPEEVARMVLHVASEQFPNMNGTSIILDGAATDF